MKNQRGEIATILTVISLGIMLIGVVVGSIAVRQRTQTQTKAGIIRDDENPFYNPKADEVIKDPNLNLPLLDEIKNPPNTDQPVFNAPMLTPPTPTPAAASAPVATNTPAPQPQPTSSSRNCPCNSEGCIGGRWCGNDCVWHDENNYICSLPPSPTGSRGCGQPESCIGNRWCGNDLKWHDELNPIKCATSNSTPTPTPPKGDICLSCQGKSTCVGNRWCGNDCAYHDDLNYIQGCVTGKIGTLPPTLTPKPGTTITQKSSTCEASGGNTCLPDYQCPEGGKVADTFSDCSSVGKICCSTKDVEEEDQLCYQSEEGNIIMKDKLCYNCYGKKIGTSWGQVVDESRCKAASFCEEKKIAGVFLEKGECIECRISFGDSKWSGYSIPISNCTGKANELFDCANKPVGGYYLQNNRCFWCNSYRKAEETGLDNCVPESKCKDHDGEEAIIDGECYHCYVKANAPVGDSWGYKTSMSNCYPDPVLECRNKQEGKILVGNMCYFCYGKNSGNSNYEIWGNRQSRINCENLSPTPIPSSKSRLDLPSPLKPTAADWDTVVNLASSGKVSALSVSNWVYEAAKYYYPGVKMKFCNPSLGECDFHL